MKGENRKKKHKNINSIDLEKDCSKVIGSANKSKGGGVGGGGGGGGVVCLGGGGVTYF